MVLGSPLVEPFTVIWFELDLVMCRSRIQLQVCRYSLLVKQIVMGQCYTDC